MDEIKPTFQEMEDEQRAAHLANRQTRQDIKAYRHEKKHAGFAAASRSGGGAKERARRAKKVHNATVDLRDVPNPPEEPGQGAAG